MEKEKREDKKKLEKEKREDKKKLEKEKREDKKKLEKEKREDKKKAQQFKKEDLLKTNIDVASNISSQNIMTGGYRLGAGMGAQLVNILKKVHQKVEEGVGLNFYYYI